MKSNSKESPGSGGQWEQGRLEWGGGGVGMGGLERGGAGWNRGDESLSRSRLCLKDIRSLLMLVH